MISAKINPTPATNVKPLAISSTERLATNFMTKAMVPIARPTLAINIPALSIAQADAGFSIPKTVINPANPINNPAN